MSVSITIKRLVRTNPPVYEGTYQGKALQVRLDSSALMKLEGTSDHEQLAEMLDPAPSLITEATRRLIEMRQFEMASDSVVVTLSALDLN